MKTKALSKNGINPIVIVLGLIDVLIIFVVLTGKSVPVLNTDRTALIGLVVIGMAICMQAGIGPMAAARAWFHPLSIISYLLGAVILAIGITALFGKQLPPLTNYHQAFITVVGISLLKVILTGIHHFFMQPDLRENKARNQ